MRLDEFTNCMHPLVEKFGDKAFDKYTCGLIWNVVKDIPFDEFKKYCDNFTGEHHRAKVSDFREAYRDWRRKTDVRTEKDYSAEPNCLLCGDSGVMLCDLIKGEKINSLPWAFRCCACNALSGQASEKQFPVLKTHQLKTYKIIDPHNVMRMNS